MASTTLLLIKLRFRLILNKVAREPSGKSKAFALAIIGALFMVADYYFFRKVMIYLDELPMDVGEILIIQLLNTLSLTLFSMLLFSNVIASISTLYLSRDLDFIISSPVKVSRLYISRLLITLVNSSWMPLLFGLPIFIAYGQVYYATFWYYLAMLFLLAPFILIPSAFGTMVAMLLARFFPARRSYQILTFIGLFFLGSLVILFRFMKPEVYLGKDVPDEMIIGFVETLKTPEVWWLPSSLLARGFQASAYSDWEIFWQNFIWLTLICGVVVSIAVVVANCVYLAGYTGAQGVRETIAPIKERLVYRFYRKIVERLAPDMKALLIKDMKLFWRETGQWSQLFILASLVVVYLFNIRNLPLNTLYLMNIVSVMNIGLAGIVLAAVANRFAFSATSLEGVSFWMIESGPIGFKRFLWAKFLLYLTPLLILAEILVVVSNYFLNVDLYVMVVSSFAVALLTIGLTGMGVGMGAIYPKFDYENVAEIGVSGGAILYMIFSLLFAGLVVAMVARPVYAHLLFNFSGKDISGAWVWIHYAGLVAVTSLVTIVPIRKGAKALAACRT